MNKESNPVPTDIKLPHITVVIATYNYGHWICDAINSVLLQDYPNKEIIVVDDKSTDNTIEILLDKYDIGSKICAIQLFKNDENKGPSYSRNRAIQESYDRTHIYSILDADDVWLPGKLSKSVIKIIENPEIGIVYTDNFGLNVNTGNLTREYRDSFSRNQIFSHNMIHSGMTINRMAFDKVGLYDENLRLAEDLDMSIRVSEHFQIYHIPEALVIARQHPNNTSNSVAQNKWKEAWAYVENKTRERLSKQHA